MEQFYYQDGYRRMGPNRPPLNRPIGGGPQMNRPQMNRLIGGGFLGPFILGGVTGGLVAPFFYGGFNRPNYYYPPYYGPGYRPSYYRPF